MLRDHIGLVLVPYGAVRRCMFVAAAGAQVAELALCAIGTGSLRVQPALTGAP